MEAVLVNPFKTYVPSERDTIGTVSSFIPKGKLKFIPNTIKKYQDGVNKAIGIILTNVKGESTTLPCSKAVSKKMVIALEEGSDKEEVLGIIAKLDVTQFVHNKTNEICQVVSAPVGKGSTEEDYLMDVLKKSVKEYADLG